MKTKQIIFAVLICLMSAFAIITAVLGQSETQIIKIEEVEKVTEIEEEPTPLIIDEATPLQLEATEPTEIINSTTTDNATTTE